MATYQLTMVMYDGARVVDEDPLERASDQEVIAETKRAVLEIAADALAAGKRPSVRAIEIFSAERMNHLASIEVSAAIASLLA